MAAFRVGASPQALLHGDFWPGNLLWNDGHLAAVLDWEDAALSPAASDVACCRAEVAVRFGLPAAHTFTEYYLACAGNSLRELTLWDFYVSAAALASMHQWGLPPEVEASRRERTAEFHAHAVESLLSMRA